MPPPPRKRRKKNQLTASVSRAVRATADPRLALSREQQRGLAQTASRREVSAARTRQKATAETPALETVRASVAGRGKLLSPAEHKKWRVEKHRFSRARGQKTATAPTYEDYINYVERKRGLRGTGAIAERAARGQFEDARTIARRRAEEARVRERELYGVLPQTSAEAIAFNAANAIPTPKKAEGILGALKEAWDFFKPGTGTLDRRVLEAIRPGGTIDQMGLNDPVGRFMLETLPEYLHRISNRVGSGMYVRGLPTISGEAMEQANLRAAEQSGINIPSLLSRGIGQIFEGLAGLPSFGYSLVHDPVGTAKQVPQAIIDPFLEPEKYPGFLALNVLGLRGAARSLPYRARSVREAREAGASVPAAAAELFRRPDYGSVEVAPGVFRTLTKPESRLTNAILDRVPGVQERRVGAARARQREVDADLMLAREAALLRRSKKVSDAEGVAQLAVETQRSIPEWRDTWIQRLDVAKSKSARQRLENAIRAADEAIGRGYVTRDESGRLIIDPARFPREASLVEAARASSEAQTRRLVELGEITPEQARARIEAPGRVIPAAASFDQNWWRTASLGQRRAVSAYQRNEKKIANIEPRLETARLEARQALDDLLREQAVLEELLQNAPETRGVPKRPGARTVIEPQGPTSETLPTLTFRTGHGGPELVSAIERQRKEVARRSREYAKWLREIERLEPRYREAIRARHETLERMAWTRDQMEAAGLPGTNAPRPEPPPGGGFYAYGGRERRHGRLGRLGAMLQPTSPMGVPRKPTRWSKRYTGSGHLDAAIDLNRARAVAESGIEDAKYLTKAEAYEAAALDSVSPTEIIRDLNEGKIKLRHVRAVRIGRNTPPEILARLGIKPEEIPARTTPATQWLLDRIFRDDKVFGKVDQDTLMAWAKAAAEDADAANQVRFIDNRKHRLETVKLRGPVHPVAAVAETATGAAKFSMLFSKATGYLIPQLFGQTILATLSDMGLRGTIGHGLKNAMEWAKYTPEERATMQAARGSGIARSFVTERNPAGAIRALNSAMAEAFGLLIDDPFRTASFRYWAVRKGYRTLEQRKRLLNAQPGTKDWQKLREIRDLVDNDWLKFKKLSPVEQEIARFIFFYPFLRASTIYTLKLPSQHPIKTAIAARMGYEEQEKAERMLVDAILQNTNEGRKIAEQAAAEIMDRYPGMTITGFDEEGNPLVRTWQAVSITQGGVDVLSLLSSLAKGDIRELTRLSTPGVSLIGAALNYDPFRGGPYPEDMNMWERIAQEVMGWSPQFLLSQRLSGDQGTTFTYTPEQARAQLFLGSQSERGLNIPKLTESIVRDMDTSPAERALRRHQQFRTELLQTAQSLGVVQGDELPEPVREALTWRAKRAANYPKAYERAAKRLGVEKLQGPEYANARAYARLEEDVRMLRRAGKLNQKDANVILRSYRNQKAKDIDRFRDGFISQLMGAPALSSLLDVIEEATGSRPQPPGWS